MVKNKNSHQKFAKAFLLSASLLMTANLVITNPVFSTQTVKAIEKNEIESKLQAKNESNQDSNTDIKNEQIDNSVEPVEPEKPVEPENPIEPTEPIEPVEPEKPIEPTEPTKPVKPVEPEKPVKPTEPTLPTKPVKPDKEEKPNNNKKPDKDKKPVKDKDKKPVKPNKTEKPNKKPTVSSEIKKKKKQAKKESQKYNINSNQITILNIDKKANAQLLADLKKNPTASTNILTGEYTTLSDWAYFDIRSVSNGEVTAERMNKVFSVVGKTNKIRNANLGDSIMRASEKHGINAGILFAMTAYETGWGSSSQFNNLNNTGGITCISGYECVGRWTKFNSLEESIDRKAQLLAGRLYVGDGLVTLYDVISRYAPAFENDVNQYVNSIGYINELYLNQKPVTIKGTKLITEINADNILNSTSASSYEIKEAIKQIELAQKERELISTKIKEQQEEQEKMKKELLQAKKEADKLKKVKDKQEMLKDRKNNVETTLTIYKEGQLKDVLN